MTDILQTIAAKTRERVALMKEARSPAAVAKAASAARHVPRALDAAFTADVPNLIAEVKYASPSQGTFPVTLPPADVAGAYLRAGAKAISVLTEPHFFRGELAYLEAVRAAHPDAVLLMKDFIVDPYQLAVARAAGADAVLVIMAMLPEAENRALFRAAGDWGLSVLVETHDEKEIAGALAMGARIVGVNSRNLKDLSVSLDTARALGRLIPPDVCAVAESGINGLADCHSLAAEGGYRGFLVGTRFMRGGDPAGAIHSFLHGKA